MTDQPIRLSRRSLIISGAAMATGALTSSSPTSLLLPPQRQGAGKEYAVAQKVVAEKPHGSLDPGLFRRALAALERHSGQIKRRDRMAIIDFSAPSSAPRFHFVDIGGGKTPSLLVAHGSGSDPGHTGFVQRFSNDFGSNASSEGAFVSGDYYVGKHGQSQRLAGLDSTNDNAFGRAIVIHGAWYANADMLRTHGKLGRSQGCFAVGEKVLADVFEHLGQGRMIYAARA
ncbi:MAG: murein L,D-transpeptidase catalytic domain family protein [Porphyrobacter sp.]|nr:murein L,D-transpeptidase catalytic domain family protein [Porphyrobacter sp.]